MHVLLFFLAILIAGAVTGLAYVISSLWLLAAVAGLAALWITEGFFERCFGYQPAQRWSNHTNLTTH